MTISCLNLLRRRLSRVTLEASDEYARFLAYVECYPKTRERYKERKRRFISKRENPLLIT